MKKILLLIAAVFVTAGLCAQSDVQIKARINKVARDMRTMQCDFVQTKILRMLNDKMVSTGRMYYKQGGLLRWEYTRPYSYVFIVNGNQVAVRNAKRNDVIDVNKSKMFKEIARIMMNSVVGKCINDSRDFKTSISTTSAEWIATLVPQKRGMRSMFQKIVLHFNRSRSMVSQVDMFEKNGDRTIIVLKNVEVNKNISSGVFSVR